MRIWKLVKSNPTAIATVVLVTLSMIGGVGCIPPHEPSTSDNFNKNYRLIFPHTTDVPVINGLATDTAWNDSFQVDLDENEGSSIHESLMRGVVDSNNIYLYFEVEDTGFNNSDVLVLAFNPSAADSDYHLLTMKPCFVANACVGNTDDDITIGELNYYTGSSSGGVITWSQQPLGSSSVTAKAAISDAGGNARWSIEMSIPRAAPYNFPDKNYFGLYANLIETDPDYNPFNGESFATQHTWPFEYNGDTGIVDVVSELTNLPVSTIWGHASLSTNIGNGVRISSNDISTNHGISTISSNEANTFYAMVHNNTLNATNTLVTAHNVRATFKWANFGLPSHSSFQKIPTDAAPAVGNPTGYADIGPTQSHTYELDWSVPADEHDFYQDNPHWCIRVELDSSDPSTVFYNSSAQHNMDFVETASPFTSKASVSTLGYRLPKGRKLHDFLIEEHFYNVDPSLKWQSTIEGMKKTAESGLYRLSVMPEKTAMLDLSILPPLKVVPKPIDVNIKSAISGTVGPSTRILVRPGQLVTLIAETAVKPLMSPGALRKTVRTELRTVPLTRGENIYPAMAQQTLIGSWDNFKKSQFPIAGAASLKAPKGASALYLALKQDRESEAQRDGSNQKVSVIVSDMNKYQLAANSSLALERTHEQRVALGANLPTVVYRGKRMTDRTITINKKVFRIYEDGGSFGYIVKGHKR